MNLPVTLAADIAGTCGTAGPGGGPDDPLCVIIKNDEPIEITGTVTIDPTQWEALCQKLVDAFDGDLEINATTVAPMAACGDGCRDIMLCVVKSQDPGKPMEVIGWSEAVDGKFVSNAGEPDFPITMGACKLSRMCVRIWLPNADGTFFSCPGPEYTVELGQDGQPKKWFVAEGLIEVDDPTEGLALNTDYVLLPCGAVGGDGEIPTDETVIIPYDVNAETVVTDNVLNGTVTLTDVCSLTVRPDVDLDCESGLPKVTVTYTDCAGNEVVETVHAGDERCYQCLGSDVTIDGTAIIYATTTQQIPIEPNEDCP